MYRLAHLFFIKGEFDKAEPGMRRARDGFKEVYGDDHPFTKIATETLMELMAKKNKLPT